MPSQVGDGLGVGGIHVRRRRVDQAGGGARAVLVTAVLAVVAALALGGCGQKPDTSPGDATIAAPPTFTSPAPVPGRVHGRNDGTSFEPCTAMTRDALTKLGLDPGTWTDVSMVAQGPRGCRATSATTTFSLLVLNAAANELYLTGAADVDDPEAQTYRFVRANSCVAAKSSGRATVLASFSDDTQPAVNQATQHAQCLKAVGVLKDLGDAIPAALTEKVGWRTTTTTACMYTYLVQAGRLQNTVFTGQPNTRVVDGASRIYPSSALAALNPDVPGIDFAVIKELGTPLWKTRPAPTPAQPQAAQPQPAG